MQTSVDVVDNVGDEFDLNAYLVDWVDSVDLVDLPTHLSWNPFNHVRAHVNQSTRNNVRERLQNLDLTSGRSVYGWTGFPYRRTTKHSSSWA